MHLRVSLQRPRRVFFRSERYRVKEDVAPDAPIQQPLHLYQVMRNRRTDVLAARKHKLNNDPFVFYDISVEMHFLIVLRNQFHIRKVALLNKLARRDVLEVVIVFARRGCLLAKQTGGSNQAACSYCRSSNSSSRQPFSPRHLSHNSCSFLIVPRPLRWRLSKDSGCYLSRLAAPGRAASWRDLHAPCCGSAWANPPGNRGIGRIGLHP